MLQPFATCLIFDCQYTAKNAVKASTQHQSRTRGVTVLLNRILISCLVGATHEGPHLSRSGAPVGASSPLELRSRRRGSLIETWRPPGCFLLIGNLKPELSWFQMLHVLNSAPALKPGWRGDETLPLLFSKLSRRKFRLPRCVSPARCGEYVSLISCCVWETSEALHCLRVTTCELLCSPLSSCSACGTVYA